MIVGSLVLIAVGIFGPQTIKEVATPLPDRTHIVDGRITIDPARMQPATRGDIIAQKIVLLYGPGLVFLLIGISLILGPYWRERFWEALVVPFFVPYIFVRWVRRRL